MRSADAETVTRHGRDHLPRDFERYATTVAAFIHTSGLNLLLVVPRERR
jgi:hypothetical protein